MANAVEMRQQVSTTITFTVSRDFVGNWTVSRRVDDQPPQSIGGYFETEAQAMAHAEERVRACRGDE